MNKSPSRYEMDMTSGPILPKMIRFSLPLMLTTILQLLYNAADMIVVGRFAGATALAAVGSTGAISGLLVNLFLGLSVGANVMVAQYYGANLKSGVSESVHTSVLLSFVGGIVIGVLGIFLSRPLLVLMATPEDVLDQAVLYMAIIFAGMPANLTYNFAAAVLRAVGDTKRPLYYLTFSGLINVLLNLLFVIVFHMGVAGVAIATVVSQVVSMILVIRCLMRQEGPLKLEMKKLRIHKDKVIQIARIGLPAGLQSSMFSISNTLIQSSINSFGSVAMAGNTAAANIEGFIMGPLGAFHSATMSFVSQNYGAKKFDRLGKCVWYGVLLVMVGALLLGVPAKIFGETLLGIYAEEQDVIDWGMIRLNIMAIGYVIGCAGDSFVSGSRGTGNSLVPMLMSILCICVFRIFWLYTIFARWHTPEVLYLSYPVSWVIANTAHMITFLVHKRRIIRRETLKAA